MDDVMRDPDFSMEIQISFGHCDPAGIVFYPNFFRWFDQCFHNFLRQRAGSHADLCKRLDAQGLGLMDAKAKFLSPATDGDVMTLELRFVEWGEKSFTLDYHGRIGDRTVVRGTELRGMFVQRDGRMRAGEMAPLQAALSLEESA